MILKGATYAIYFLYENQFYYETATTKKLFVF